ncbi:MAG: M13 family metallopeptidase [Bryobacteraceae bacterium]
MSRLYPLAVLFCCALGAQDLKTTPSFDLSALDPAVKPCDNFYKYSCGTWLKNNPIPPDQSSWGRFSELQERNRAILRDILEKAAVENPNRTAVEQKIGDHYASCMDEAAINRKGTEPLKPELDRIAGLSNEASIAEEIARLHALGVNALFSFGSGQDFKNSNEVIAQADQGGMGLPDRDYYLKADPKSVETRRKYVEHVQKIFELLGNKSEAAAAKSKAVMSIETALAKGALDLVSRRDPVKVYHRIDRAELVSLDPAFGWPRYLEGTHTPPIQSLNVTEPEFFKSLNSILKDTKLDDLKTYLTWQLVSSQAPLLPTAFVDANFEFFRKTLTGAKELQPRWKRCVALTDNELGEALGQEYVARTFGAEGKERTLKMVKALEQALGEDIQKLDWMTPETKVKAMEKLHAITNKIGYPDKWRDYSAVKIVRGEALGNSERASAFEFHRQLAKIGQPVDRLEWGMTPPTVNAYYDPQMNNINFPAGILQPPFYNLKADDAVNFGAIGAVIGHELTHGFDDQGRQFDPKGNLNDWWTPKDADAFESRADCLVKEYSSFTAVDDVKLNGKLTLGENTADNGGLRIAYMALMSRLAEGQEPGKIDGFTPGQRFFLGWGQIWCDNYTPEIMRLQAQTNPHSLAEYRVNGVVSNMPEFQKAFGCKAGQPMVRDNACRVW